MAKKRINIDTAYNYFQYAGKILGEKRQRRLAILEHLQDNGEQTFKELKKGTKISAGILY